MKPSDRSSRIFVKVLVLFFGLLALSFLFLIEKLGGVLAVSVSRFYIVDKTCNMYLFRNFKKRQRKILDHDFQVTNSLAAIAAGTSFGVFTLGVLFPWANSKVRERRNLINSRINKLYFFFVDKFLSRFAQGAFIGAVAGFLMAGWASFGANAAIGSGLVVPKKLPVPPCDGNINHDFVKQFEYSR